MSIFPALSGIFNVNGILISWWLKELIGSTRKKSLLCAHYAGSHLELQFLVATNLAAGFIMLNAQGGSTYKWTWSEQKHQSSNYSAKDIAIWASMSQSTKTTPARWKTSESSSMESTRKWKDWTAAQELGSWKVLQIRISVTCVESSKAGRRSQHARSAESGFTTHVPTTVNIVYCEL